MQGAVIFQISLHFHVIMKGRPLNIVVMKHRFLNVVFTPKKEGGAAVGNKGGQVGLFHSQIRESGNKKNSGWP